MKTELSVISLGSFGTNCWLVKDKDSSRAVLVDPGFYCAELEKFLENNDVTALDYILITHGHMDHICGAAYVKEKYGGKIVIGEKDADALYNCNMFFGDNSYKKAFRPCKADITVAGGEELLFADGKIRVMFTPGHTEGEVCYIINDMFFSGDVLFRGSMGRTDLPGGNVFTLYHTLKKIGSLEENYRILPGHMEKTTLDFEKETNMYLKAACSRK